MTITGSVTGRELDIIESVEGKNFSAKLSFIINKFADTCGVVVRVIGEDNTVEEVVPGAFLVYHEDPSEKYWSDCRVQFKGLTLSKKRSELLNNLKTIRNAGFLAQIIEKPEEGFVQLWAAPIPQRKNCEDCIENIVKAARSCL